VWDLWTTSKVAGDVATANRRVVGPGESETSSRNQVKHHLGLYVFQRDALLEYPTLPQPTDQNSA